MEKPLILISNDDGIEAKGINALVDMVSDLGDIIVCAPSGPRSGQSRAFTMGDLTFTSPADLPKGEDAMAIHPADATTENYNDDHTAPLPSVTRWVCSGTPVDCIKMAYGLACPRRPSLVLGGINHGSNASTNAHYSGTIGVVFEGCMKGIPSIAFSLCDYDLDANFEPMRPIVRQLCQHVLANGLPHYTCLNVNVPKVSSADELQGVRFCRMAYGRWRAEVERKEGRLDESGNQIYRLEGYYKNDEPHSEDTDAWALENNYIAVTPCTIDITDYKLLKDISKQFTYRS